MSPLATQILSLHHVTHKPRQNKRAKDCGESYLLVPLWSPLRIGKDTFRKVVWDA